MKIIKPRVEVINLIEPKKMMQHIEKVGRLCWKSEEKITDESYKKFIEMILKREHEAVIEHSFITAIFVCDRGVTHEIVRHRLFSYAQESTRYCNYSNDKFGKELTFIDPCFWNDTDNTYLYLTWKDSMEKAERDYLDLIEHGATPQEARSVLPNSLKTEIAVSGNFREWRHFFKLRCALAAHPQMREVASMAYNQMFELYPEVFSGLDG